MERGCSITVTTDPAGVVPPGTPSAPLPVDPGALVHALLQTLRQLGIRELEAAGAATGAAHGHPRDCAVPFPGGAAGRVVLSAEQAWQAQKRLQAETGALREFLESAEDCSAMRQRTRAFAATVEVVGSETNAHLFEIMLAQEGGDPQGRPLQHIMVLARELEARLSSLLPGEEPALARAAGTAGEELSFLGARDHLPGAADEGAANLHGSASL